MSLPIYGMALTPMRAEGRVDVESLRRHAAQLVTDGCDAIIGLGVIAEPRALTLPEKVTVIENLLSGGVATYVTVMRAADTDGLEEARTLSSIFRGALAGLMVPVTRPSARGLRADLRAVAEASGLQLIVQDYPQPTGVAIEVDELIEAIDGLEEVVAIKEEGMPTVGRIHEIRRRTGVRILSGLGGASLVHDLLAGADAVACGISRPDLVRSALDGWTPGDPHPTQRVMAELSALTVIETQPRTSIAFRKEHWRLRGVIAENTVSAGTAPYETWMRRHSALAGYHRGGAHD